MYSFCDDIVWSIKLHSHVNLVFFIVVVKMRCKDSYMTIDKHTHVNKHKYNSKYS